MKNVAKKYGEISKIMRLEKHELTDLQKEDIVYLFERFGGQAVLDAVKRIEKEKIKQ